MFGVKAIPVQPSPASLRLISLVPSYGFCVAATIVLAQMKKLPCTPKANAPAVSCCAVSVNTPKSPLTGVVLATLGSHQTLSMDKFSAEDGLATLEIWKN